MATDNEHCTNLPSYMQLWIRQLTSPNMLVLIRIETSYFFNARFKDKDHHTLKSSYYHRFEECLWKISVWRAMLTDPFILPFYPNKKQDTLPLGVDMHTREVRTSGRGKGYVGIGPLYMIGKVIDCLFSNSFLPQMFENTFWLRDK